MLSHLALHTTDDPTNTSELAVDAAFVAIGHIPNTVATTLTTTPTPNPNPYPNLNPNHNPTPTPTPTP